MFVLPGCTFHMAKKGVGAGKGRKKEEVKGIKPTSHAHLDAFH